MTAQTLVVATPGDKPAPGQKLFSSDHAAAAALLAALKEQNHHQLELIFGPDIKALASGDKVEDHRHFERFVAHAKKRFQLERDGRMVRGFALIAYPEKYGASGVVTFIVNQQGQVYQKNLGLRTITLARNIRSYNPDTSWTPVK